MDSKVNVLNWFELPVHDMARAKRFYEAIFGITMDKQEMMKMDMAFFPYEPGSGKLAGALVKSGSHKPSPDGVIIYLNGNPDLSVPLAKVEKAGGKIIMPKTQIAPDIGYMAFLTDTEGNRVALHSQQ